MVPGPLIKAWADTYSKRNPNSAVKYQASSPADGIKRLLNKEVDFSVLDMPLSNGELKKDGLLQFPFALGAVTPIVNLPNVYSGQLRLDAKTLGDIFFGNIKKWNDPAIAIFNPDIRLPAEDIIIIHRESPQGLSTIIGDYLAKKHPQWKATKGDGMAGTWPATAIEVHDPHENIEQIKKTPYSIGYGPVPMALKNKLAYVQMKNMAGKFVSPSDENISAAAASATWDESNGFDVVLTDQPGNSSWPLTMAAYVLVRKLSEHPERGKEMLNYFKYNFRNGGLNAVQNDFVPLPPTVTAVIRSSWDKITDAKGVPVLKD